MLRDNFENIKEIRVYHLRNGKILFGVPENSDLNQIIMHYPRAAQVEGRTVSLFMLVGDPRFLIVNMDSVDYFYDTDNASVVATYQSTIPKDNLIVVPSTKLRM